jgi:membrane associated rhomboid family serine protease
VQAGGIARSIFNIVSLLLIGNIAEQLWGSKKQLILFLLDGFEYENASFDD